MKIAIHHTLGSYSDRWIQYCNEKQIHYKIVNAYNPDIVDQVSDCTAFMWNHHHANYRDVLFAKQLLFSLQTKGLKVFPDFYTTWHFDDKVGQKYLLECIGAPLVPSYVFYSKKEALAWIKTTKFPKVFKLRGGAGSANVKLVNSKKQARKMVGKAFGSGFSQFDRLGYLKERYCRFRAGKDSFLGVLKGIARLVVPTEFAKYHAPEKGYVYFQDFISDNNYDFRVKVVLGRCWAFRRKVRKRDFRASGSGLLDFNINAIPLSMVEIAFKTTQQLHLQSVAFDFVMKGNAPLITEMSYGFGIDEGECDNGYWTPDLVWHEDAFCPQDLMVEQLLRQ